MDLQTATVESFTPFLGTTFATESGELTLVTAQALPTRAHAPGVREPFRLHFTGAPPLLPQGIHPLTHPSLEELEIFLVPIAADANHITYEAIFN